MSNTSNKNNDYMTVILKHSTVRGRVPSPSDLKVGEIALSLYNGEEAIWTKNANNKVIKLNEVTAEGLWSDTSSGAFRSYTSYEAFETDLADGLISEYSVVYISDPENKGIWTRGTFYPTLSSDNYYTKDDIDLLLTEKQDQLVSGEGILIKDNTISANNVETIDTPLTIVLFTNHYDSKTGIYHASFKDDDEDNDLWKNTIIPRIHHNQWYLLNVCENFLINVIISESEGESSRAKTVLAKIEVTGYSSADLRFSLDGIDYSISFQMYSGPDSESPFPTPTVTAKRLDYIMSSQDNKIYFLDEITVSDLINFSPSSSTSDSIIRRLKEFREDRSAIDKLILLRSSHGESTLVPATIQFGSTFYLYIYYNNVDRSNVVIQVIGDSTNENWSVETKTLFDSIISTPIILYLDENSYSDGVYHSAEMYESSSSAAWRYNIAPKIYNTIYEGDPRPFLVRLAITSSPTEYPENDKWVVFTATKKSGGILELQTELDGVNYTIDFSAGDVLRQPKVTATKPSHLIAKLVAGDGIEVDGETISANQTILEVVDELPFTEYINLNQGGVANYEISSTGDLITNPSGYLWRYGPITDKPDNAFIKIGPDADANLTRLGAFTVAFYKGEPHSSTFISGLDIETFPEVIKVPDEARYIFIQRSGEPYTLRLGTVTPNPNKIYVVPNSSSDSGENSYTEWIWVNNSWEKVGGDGEWKIPDGSITTEKLADGAVTEDKLSPVFIKKLSDKERVIATALTDLDSRKSNKDDVDELQNRVTELEGNELVVATALTDLDSRKLDKSVLSDYSTTEEMESVISTAISTQAVATELSNGLMCAEDKYRIDYIFLGNANLVSPVLSGEWVVKDNSGTEIERSTNLNIEAIVGCTATWTGVYRWNSQEGYRNPEIIGSGSSWGTLTEDGVDSPVYEVTKTSTGSIVISIGAKKVGLVVDSSGSVVPAGDDEYVYKTAKSNVTFKYISYFGKITKSNPEASDILLLDTTRTTSKKFTAQNVTLNENEYLVYAYPYSLGALSNIIQDDTIPVLGAFTEMELDLPGDSVISGVTTKLRVYISNNPGAFTNSTLEFK